MQSRSKLETDHGIYYSILSELEYFDPITHTIALTGDERSHQHLVQRLSIALQRGNAASVLGTLSKDADFGD